jgi:hypothetical protein
MKRITDPSFKYTPSHSTNLKATFARIRKERKQAQQVSQADSKNVLPIKPTKIVLP